MCGRYVLLRPDIRELMKRLQLERLFAQVTTDSRYNVGPGQPVLAVRQSPADEACLEEMTWGWKKESDAAPGRARFMINARAETVWQSPTFRDAAKSRRCLLPASGFYEWNKKGGGEPWLFRLRDEAPFFLAGIWEPAARQPEVVVITTAPNAVLESIHDRMPVILEADRASEWLSAPGRTEGLKELLRPFPEGRMMKRRVSTYVNAIRNEGPECLAEPQDPPPAPQAEFVF